MQLSVTTISHCQVGQFSYSSLVGRAQEVLADNAARHTGRMLVSDLT